MNKLFKRVFQKSTVTGTSVLAMVLSLYFGPAEVDALVLAIGSAFAAFKTLEDNDRF